MKKAFTLAEILISMTIIGVISLLMIPVMQNTQLKSLETATAHFYSMMSQAIKQYMVDNDTTQLTSTPLYWDMELPYNQQEEEVERAFKEVDNFVYKYLKVNKVCDYENMTDCFSKKIFNLKGEPGNFKIYTRHGVCIPHVKVYVLDNGTVFTMAPSHDEPATIQVDVNGKKGPNIVGRDIWEMNVYADGVISEKIYGYQHHNHGKLNAEIEQRKKDAAKWQFELCYSSEEGTIWEYAAGCFARFEYNGYKFDY